MGWQRNITIDKAPKEGRFYKARVEVCFHYDTSKTIMGTVIRDDAEEPWETIILLDNGRVVRAVECQYSVRELHSANQQAGARKP